MDARLKMGAQAAAVALVAALLALLVWKVVADSGGVKVEAGGAAPPFSLRRLNGDGELSLASLRGKVVVINFWASWCGPCKDEAPALEELWRDNRDDGLVALGINFNDLRSDARAFVRETGMSYPVVVDRDGSLADDYGLTGVPETFVVDRRGRLVGEVIAGPVNEGKFADVLRSYIEEARET